MYIFLATHGTKTVLVLTVYLRLAVGLAIALTVIQALARALAVTALALPPTLAVAFVLVLAVAIAAAPEQVLTSCKSQSSFARFSNRISSSSSPERRSCIISVTSFVSITLKIAQLQ